MLPTDLVGGKTAIKDLGKDIVWVVGSTLRRHFRYSVFAATGRRSEGVVAASSQRSKEASLRELKLQRIYIRATGRQEITQQLHFERNCTEDVLAPLPQSEMLIVGLRSTLGG